MGGIFRLQTAAPTSTAPVWTQPIFSSFPGGQTTAKDFSAFVADADTPFANLTFSQAGTWPAGVSVVGSGVQVSSLAQVTTFTGLQAIVSDGTTAVTSPAFTVQVVKATNRPPVWNQSIPSKSMAPTASVPATFNFNTVCSDLDNDLLQYERIQVLPAGFSLSTSGILTVTTAATTGSIALQFRAWDGGSVGTGASTDSPPITFVVTQNAVLPTVTWQPLSATYPVLQTGSVNIGSNASSNLGYAMTFSIASGSLTGTGVTLNQNTGTFNVSAGATVQTIAGLSMRADDGHGNAPISTVFSLIVNQLALSTGGPVYTSFPNQVTIVQGETQQLSYFSYSPAGYTMLASVVQGTLPVGQLSMDTAGVLTADANADTLQYDNLRMRWDDQHGKQTDSPPFSIVVKPSSTRPGWINVPPAINIYLPPLAPPTGVTLTVSPTGGQLGPGTYSYRVSACGPGDTRLSESPASAPVQVTIASGNTNKIVVSWTAVPLTSPLTVVDYLLYGRTPGNEKWMDYTGSYQFTSITDTGGTAITARLPLSSPKALFRISGSAIDRHVLNVNTMTYAVAPSSSLSSAQLSALGITLDTSLGQFAITDTTPVGNYTGIRLRITDGGQSSDSPPFGINIITIQNPNPRWGSTLQQAFGVKQGFSLIHQAWPNAVSPIGQTLTFAVSPLSAISAATLAAADTASGGGISFGASGVTAGDIIISPTAKFGSYTGIVLRATDTTGNFSDSAPFLLYVLDASPVWTTPLTKFNLRRGQTVNPGENASSPNNYAMTFAIQTGTLPTGVTFDTATGKFTAATTAALGLVPGFSLKATDTFGNSSISKLFSINVLAQPAIQPVGFPATFGFTVGVPKTYDLSTYFVGSPTSITLNKSPPLEGTLFGVTYNAITKLLSYDGSPGTGRADNYVAVATDGADPHHEHILPYSVTKPFQSAVTPNLPSNQAEHEAAGPCGKVTINERSPDQHDIADMFHGGNAAMPVMEWVNRTGDWWDATPSRQGLLPFSTLVVPQGTAGFPKFTDITKLVQLWQAGTIPNYGIMLQYPSTGGSTYLRGPGYTGSASGGEGIGLGSEGPWLDLVFSDNSTARLAPNVCAGINTGALGTVTKPAPRFGDSTTSFVFYDLSIFSLAITQAHFTATPTNTFTNVTYGIFAVRWEGQVAGDPITWGLAENYPPVAGVLDANMESDPAVITVERFLDINLTNRGAWTMRDPSGTTTKQYIVGDVDPEDPGNYAPLAPGVKAVKWKILGGGIDDGTVFAYFKFYGLFGKGPSISSTYNSALQEVYLRWYERWADDFNFGTTGPNIGGHASGLIGFCSGDDLNTSTDVPYLMPQTGRYSQNPNYLGGLFADSSHAFVTNFETVASETTSYLGTYGARIANGYRYDPGIDPAGSGSGTPTVFETNHRGISQKNRWRCMELCVKINSQYPGMNQILSNGVERVWIDGRPASRKYDCMLTMTSIDGVSHAELQFYYGGTGNTPTPLSVYQSQFAIARTYIGPALF